MQLLNILCKLAQQYPRVGKIPAQPAKMRQLYIFRPHRMHSIDAAYWYSRVAWPMCLCHVTTTYPAKTAGPIEMPFGMCDGVGHSNYVLDGGPHHP